MQDTGESSDYARRSTNWRIKSDVPASVLNPNLPAGISKQTYSRNRGADHKDGHKGQSRYSSSPRAGGNAYQYKKDDSTALQAITEGRRLYVGNMPYFAKSEDVESLFAGHDYKIQRISISIDPFTGRNPSYCFVELENKEQADRAMSNLNGKMLLSRPVKIKPCVPKASGGGVYGRVDKSAYVSVMWKAEIPPEPLFDRFEREDADSHWKGVSQKGCRLYVGGLPRMPDQPTAEAEVRRLMEGFQIDAVSKIISPHPSTRDQPGNHFYLFVDLPTSMEADAAIKALNGKSLGLGGKVLRVAKAKDDSWKADERDSFLRKSVDGI